MIGVWISYDKVTFRYLLWNWTLGLQSGYKHSLLGLTHIQMRSVHRLVLESIRGSQQQHGYSRRNRVSFWCKTWETTTGMMAIFKYENGFNFRFDSCRVRDEILRRMQQTPLKSVKGLRRYRRKSLRRLYYPEVKWSLFSKWNDNDSVTSLPSKTYKWMRICERGENKAGKVL